MSSRFEASLDKEARKVVKDLEREILRTSSGLLRNNLTAAVIVINEFLGEGDKSSTASN